MTLQDIKNRAKKQAAQQKSKAVQMRQLFKLYKGLIKKREERAQFEGNALQLIRGNGNVEFFRNATTGLFEFTHSDGTTRRALLDTAYLLNFKYGNDWFRGYILPEDRYFPIKPGAEDLDGLTLNKHINNIFNENMNWKAQELTAEGRKWRQLMIGIGTLIAIVVGLILLTWILAPDLVEKAFGLGAQAAPIITQPMPTGDVTIMK